MKIRAAGLENRIVVGRRRRFLKDVFSEFARVAAPEAFSIIELLLLVFERI